MARNFSVARLQAILDQLPAELKAPIKAATERQAHLMAESMRLRAPIGPSNDPNRGKLRQSVRVEKGRREMVYLVRAGGAATTVGGGNRGFFGRLFFGSGAYDYSLGVEFGTQNMNAQPFFWPGYRARKDDTRRTIKAAAKAAIKKAWHE
jgi:HK97 gp10 family phage protein